MTMLRELLTPAGRLFVNMPINSPAPDHLFNKATPDDLSTFFEWAGFLIEERFFAPATNYSLEKCIRKNLTISCGYILRRKS